MRTEEEMSIRQQNSGRRQKGVKRLYEHEVNRQKSVKRPYEHEVNRQESVKSQYIYIVSSQGGVSKMPVRQAEPKAGIPVRNSPYGRTVRRPMPEKGEK